MNSTMEPQSKRVPVYFTLAGISPLPKRSCTYPEISIPTISPSHSQNRSTHVNLPNPPHLVRPKNLKPRLQFGLMQIKIIHRADPRKRHAWILARPPIHQRPADLAEMVLHRVTAGDGGRLGEACEFVFAAKVLKVGVFDYEGGGEDGGCDLDLWVSGACKGRERVGLEERPCGSRCSGRRMCRRGLRLRLAGVLSVKDDR